MSLGLQSCQLQLETWREHREKKNMKKRSAEHLPQLAKATLISDSGYMNLMLSMSQATRHYPNSTQEGLLGARVGY